MPAGVNAIIGFIVYWLIVYIVTLNFVPNLASSLLISLVFTLGTAALITAFTRYNVFPFKLNRMLMLTVGVAGVAFSLMSAGVLSGFNLFGLGTASVTQPTAIQVSVPSGQAACQSSIADDIKGTAATLDVNAWDLESNSPYVAAVDVPCWVFKNDPGVPTNYVTTITDTSAGTITGLSVGDTAYIYCGGATYYTDPVEGLCVNDQRKPVNLNTHIAEAVTSLDITAYDRTGSATLTAGATDVTDYNISLGADQEDAIELRLQVNSADNAWNHCGWALGINNATDFKPIGGDFGGDYVKDSTPLFLKNIANVMLTENSPASTGPNSNTTLTYTPYVLSAPVMLSEWDLLQDRFSIQASSSDPIGDAHNSTGITWFAGVSFDCQYARGDDGKMYLDYFNHTSTQTNAGVIEDFASPTGGLGGVTIGAT